MRPSTPEILRGIRTNIEELMAPQLEGPHARSAAENTLMLLDHVILRIEKEGEALTADNREKRTVLAELASAVTGTEDLGTRARALAERLDAIPAAGSYLPVSTLTAEAEALRALATDWILALHEARSDLGDELIEDLLAPVREQLRAQVDRDAELVAPVELPRIFQSQDA